MSVNQSETAEAIIVVGPYLWKCVNCNLLMSRQHSIDDHLVSRHNCLLKPDISLNAQCKLSVCGCQKTSQADGEWKENQRTKHTRKRRKSPFLPDDSELLESTKHCDFKTFEKEEKSGSDVDEKDETFVESSFSLPDQDSKEKDTADLNLKSDEGEDIDCRSNVHEGREVWSKLYENSQNESCNMKPATDDGHSERTISVNSGKTESGNKFETEKEEEQNTCTRKSSRSNKGKNSLYSEFEMRIS